MRHVLFRFSKRGGKLKPFDPELWAQAIEEWPEGVLYVELQDEKRAHTRQQEKFWFGVICPFIAELWKAEMGWAVVPANAKDIVHDTVMRAVYGEIDTPLGKARKSSKVLTLEQYSELIEWAKEYVWIKYQRHTPEPGEEPA